MDARRQVVRAAEARARALADGDAVRLRQLLHEQFRWTSHAGETFGREDYIARNTGGTVSWRSQELREVDVTVVGETAVLYAEVVDVVGDDAEPARFRMPMTQVWVRQEQTWRCVAGHAGPLRH